MANPYQVLGVSANATDDEIRDSYRDLLRKYNEELTLPSPACDVAKDKIIALNNAYDEIMNMRRGGTHQTSQFSDIRRYIAQNRTSEADELLEGVPMTQRNAEWHFLKGSVLHSKGWLDMAHKHFAEAVRLNPDNAEYGFQSKPQLPLPHHTSQRLFGLRHLFVAYLRRLLLRVHGRRFHFLLLER